MRDKKWWLLAASAVVALAGMAVLCFRHGRQEYLHTVTWYVQRRREYLQEAAFYAQKRMSYWNYKNSLRTDIETVRKPYRCIGCQLCRQYLPEGSVKWHCKGCPMIHSTTDAKGETDE